MKEDSEFKVGDKVFHRNLLECGTITMLGEDHCGSNFSMIVHFESLGEELEVSTSLLNKI